ncbi:hypothetical protein AWB80_07512 [Caballeronia pedi]|uniref:Uncharacterized protein n=1 Tax=Caballeronia pedi TaxID=1777141 RepID=A0A158DUZ8_9BURK|nr:hypothetical protein AWB80_07512 [Caballeronia pedi]
MKWNRVRIVWCGLACWRFGVWRAPRGQAVIECGPVEIVLRRAS